MKFLTIIPIALGSFAPTGLSQNQTLEQQLQGLAKTADGPVGACVLDINSSTASCVNGGSLFPLQSVMKLIVGAAIMDAADRNTMSLNDTIIVRPQDTSPGPREFSNLVKQQGQMKVRLIDLIRHSIIDSDSTSVDLLIQHLGGISSINKFLNRNDIRGISIDRDERQLQSESSGLRWKPEYSDLDKFESAIQNLPAALRKKAFSAYLDDPRDTATPMAMALFLKKLAKGELLSKQQTTQLMDIMSETRTGQDRLRAGTPKDWTIGHKTGTGISLNGMSSAINDVGILRGPSGQQLAVAVFIKTSTKDAKNRAAFIAHVAKMATEWHKKPSTTKRL
jgi:beta-lactamase class A